MDMLSFLRLVLPPQGNYASFHFRKNAKGDTVCCTTKNTSIEQLANTCALTDAEAPGISYTMSSLGEDRLDPKTQVVKFCRMVDDVVAVKAFWMDIDCGSNKPYPSWAEGLAALDAFVVASRMPAPLVVFSGSGLHVYWPLLEPITREYWQPLAYGLRVLASRHGLELDPVCTINSVVGLRAPGTHNPKNGEEVRIIRLIEGGFPLGAIEPLLRPYADDPTVGSSIFDDLSTQPEFAPSNGVFIATECKQIVKMIQEPNKVDEQEWYALVGVAAFCQNPEETAKAWSSGHDDYDPTKTVDKMNQWKGATNAPTTCKRFQALRPKGCAGCKLKGLIKTPASMGRVLEAVEPEQPPVPPEAPAGAPVEKIPKPPPPYKYIKGGGVAVSTEAGDVEICDFTIYPVSYGRDERLGYEVVRYRWERPHEGWVYFTLPQAHLIQGSNEFSTSLANAGITSPLITAAKTQEFRNMLTLFTEKLRNDTRMVNVWDVMGWKKDRTAFVIGDTTFEQNIEGKVVPNFVALSESAQRETPGMYVERGSTVEWINLTSYLADNALHHFMFALGVGFSSPLYAFTGLKGLAISYYGKTGGGKTLAQRFCQSIYGDHERLHIGASFTFNALYARIAQQGNMVVSVDEATTWTPTQAGEFVYNISQGLEKLRMTSQQTTPPSKDWATPAMLSTNISLVSKLAATGKDTDAQLARLLEFSIEQSPVFRDSPEAGREIYDMTLANCGGAGREYLQHLVELGEEAIKERIAEATRTFTDRYGVSFAGQERYWGQAIILADVGLSIAKELRLIKFAPEDGIKWALSQIPGMRTTVQEAQVSAIDTLSEFMAQNMENTVVVVQTTNEPDMVDRDQLPRRELRLRMELKRETRQGEFVSGAMYICRKTLRSWLVESGHDINTFSAGMKACMIADTTGNYAPRMQLGKGTGIKTNQTYVMGLNLSHPMLEAILERKNQATEGGGSVVPIRSATKTYTTVPPPPRKEETDVPVR